MQEHLNRAIEKHQAGAFDEAESLYREVLRLDPEHPDALHLLGVLGFQTGHAGPARQLVEQAVRLRPDSAHYLESLAQILTFLEDDVAFVAVQQALIRMDAPSLETWLALARAQLRLGQYDQAAAALQSAERIAPANPWVLNLSGHLYQHQGDYSRAEAAYRQALISLRSPDILSNLAIALHEQGRYEQALSCWSEALQLDPKHAESQMNTGMSRLLQGEWLSALDVYEPWRWRVRGNQQRPFVKTVPLWDGSELSADQALLIHAEQGLGDTLQFMRYLPLAARRASRIVFECQDSLTELVQAALPGVSVIGQSDPLPPFAVQLPLLSLPWVLQASQKAEVFPYLSARDAGRLMLPESDSASALKIGLVWASGNLDPRLYHKRSLPLARCHPLFEVPDLSWYSLQLGPDASELAAGDWPLNDLSPLLQNFQDTADLLIQLDLLISVDTAVAHLAGAMGQPVWLLLPHVPDWRWGLNSPETVWYPGMRLFRQPQLADWPALISDVVQALQEWLVQLKASR